MATWCIGQTLTRQRSPKHEPREKAKHVCSQNSSFGSSASFGFYGWVDKKIERLACHQRWFYPSLDFERANDGKSFRKMILDVPIMMWRTSKSDMFFHLYLVQWSHICHKFSFFSSIFCTTPKNFHRYVWASLWWHMPLSLSLGGMRWGIKSRADIIQVNMVWQWLFKREEFNMGAYISNLEKHEAYICSIHSSSISYYS